MPITLASAQAQDARDALAPLRQEFNLPDGVIYLDGNSLGAQPKAALARAQQVIQQEWGVGLIRSWNTAGWFELPQRLGNQLGKLVGAKDGEVVVTDTTSDNLFKVLAAALPGADAKTCCPNARTSPPTSTLPRASLTSSTPTVPRPTNCA